MADQIELIGDQRDVLNELDHREHQSQITRDRCLTRGDGNQVCAHGARSGPELASLTRDRRDSMLRGIPDRGRDRRQRVGRVTQSIDDSPLEPGELLSERVTHTPHGTR